MLPHVNICYMVFARAKLVMEDNCFTEEPSDVSLKIQVPNPAKMYKKAYDAVKAVFRVSDSDIQETAYNWSKSPKGDKFKVRWWMHKDMDLFSYLFIRFDLAGEGSPSAGTFSITISALLRTEYPQDTVWQRSLFYEILRTFWHRMFYHHKREQYAEECRHSTVVYTDKLKELTERIQRAVEEEKPAEKPEK